MARKEDVYNELQALQAVYNATCLEELDSETTDISREKIVLHKQLKPMPDFYVSNERIIRSVVADYKNSYMPRNPNGISFYDSVLAKMQHFDSYDYTPVLSVRSWLLQFWPDYFYISPDGRVEFNIQILDMIQDRVYSSEEDSSKTRQEDYFRLCCLRDSACMNDKDEDYCDSIKVLMKEYLSGREGRVIIIKGVNESNMTYAERDRLEYHWIPEEIGKDFNP